MPLVSQPRSPADDLRVCLERAKASRTSNLRWPSTPKSSREITTPPLALLPGALCFAPTLLAARDKTLTLEEDRASQVVHISNQATQQGAATAERLIVAGAYLLTPSSPLKPTEVHSTRSARACDIDFVHPFEALVADFFDFYGVAWEYEPHLFCLEWDEEGEGRRFFRPDFYLPDEGYYLELTAAGPRTVTTKNGSLRKMRSLYPDTDVRLWRARDYAGLAARMGVAPEGMRRLSPRNNAEEPLRLEGAGERPVDG